jgi:MFS family permease
MKDKIRNSLKYSFFDGAFYATMFGFGDTYFSPYAIFLKATNLQMGLLTALPGLFSSLSQLRAPEFTEKVGRKKFMTITAFAQAAMCAPIIFIPFVFKTNPVPYVIAAVTLYSMSLSLSLPAWSSIISQYLPRDKRGQYFSWRQKTCGFITIAATLAAGVILYMFPRTSIYGFTILFSVAMVARFVSWHYLKKMHEPRLNAKPESYFSFLDFISRTKQSNFAKFVFFAAFISFANNVSSPFFAVYMLRELKFDYITYVVLAVLPTIAMLVSLPAWGKHADKAGCVQVIRLTSLLLPIIPMLWLVSTNKIYLGVIQAFSGFAWGGFNLSVSNFIFDAVSEEKRVRCISYYNLINGLGLFAGAVLGGLIVSVLPPIFGSSLLTIFLLSGLLRLAVRTYFVPKIKEVKQVRSLSNLNLFFSVTGIKPMMDSSQAATRSE